MVVSPLAVAVAASAVMAVVFTEVVTVDVALVVVAVVVIMVVIVDVAVLTGGVVVVAERVKFVVEDGNVVGHLNMGVTEVVAGDGAGDGTGGVIGDVTVTGDVQGGVDGDLTLAVSLIVGAAVTVGMGVAGEVIVTVAGGEMGDAAVALDVSVAVAVAVVGLEEMTPRCIKKTSESSIWSPKPSLNPNPKLSEEDIALLDSINSVLCLPSVSSLGGVILVEEVIFLNAIAATLISTRVGAISCFEN